MMMLPPSFRGDQPGVQGRYDAQGGYRSGNPNGVHNNSGVSKNAQLPEQSSPVVPSFIRRNSDAFKTEVWRNGQHPNLGRYRPPMMGTDGSQDPRDAGPYSYNLPNAYGTGPQYSDGGFRNRISRFDPDYGSNAMMGRIGMGPPVDQQPPQQQAPIASAPQPGNLGGGVTLPGPGNGDLQLGGIVGQSPVSPAFTEGPAKDPYTGKPMPNGQRDNSGPMDPAQMSHEQRQQYYLQEAARRGQNPMRGSQTGAYHAAALGQPITPQFLTVPGGG